MLEIAAAVLVVTARISWYHPATCFESPINCLNPATWWQTASGEDARAWYWKGLACPSDYPFGTKFVIENSKYGLADHTWICIDRGGAIVTRSDGTIVLDLLTDKPVWGDVLPVTVRLPPRPPSDTYERRSPTGQELFKW